MRSILVGLVGLVAVAGLTGCGVDDGNPKPEPAPEVETTPWPGPLGVTQHTAITNYVFSGYPNEQADHGTNGLKVIQLSDFWNPTGSGSFPKGSPYGDGTPLPKVLLIDVSSVWCGPCNEEAKSTLPGLYAMYKPRGGEFLVQLEEGPTPGTPAVEKNLFNWTNGYKISYPAVIDPSGQLGSLFQESAFPANLIVDTKTMQIVAVVAGDPAYPSSFWDTYESYLNP